MLNRNRKQSANELADKAIEMADTLTRDIRNLNGNTHTIKAMISDIWHYRENTPFVTTVFEAIQEVKPSN